MKIFIILIFSKNLIYIFYIIYEKIILVELLSGCFKILKKIEYYMIVLEVRLRGGPLLSSKTHKVIGIYMGCLMEPKHINIGSLLSQALSEFLNNYLK